MRRVVPSLARMISGPAMLAVMVLAGTVTAAKSPAQAQTPASEGTFTLWPKWGPFLDLEGKVGTKRDIGEADLFVPVWQDERAMLFGDVRFKADDQNGHEGNFGLGYRRMLDGGWNAGGYGYFDHRRTPTGNLFDQLTFGAELLGTNFDLRANTYWPIGVAAQPVGQPTVGASTATVSGTSLIVNTPAILQTMEYALRGFDAEAGVRIPITPAESPYNLRFYAGGYRFDEPTGSVPVIAGPRLRLEFTDYQVPGLWNGTRFSVGAEWQTDAVRGSQFFAGLRLRVPLASEPGRASFTLQERRMTDPIVRDVDIVAGTQSVTIAPAVSEPATATSGGQTVAVINSASTSGAQLQTALNTAGANSTVVLSGTFNTSSTTTLQAGQTVAGSGALGLRTASGRVVTAYLQGNGTVAGTINSAATLAMANNSTIMGLTVNNAGGGGGITSAIEASGVTGTTVTNTGITVNGSGTGAAQGIRVVSGASLTATGNTLSITNTGTGNAHGLWISSSTATGTSNTITTHAAAADSSAFVLDGSTATLTGNTATSTGTGSNIVRPFFLSTSTVTMSGNSVSASGSTRSYVVDVAGTTINSGSTGNVRRAGVCNDGGTNTGKVFFTDGTTCP
jgi:hypothetical protein